jgi:hemolysin activation/secretion protein
MNVKVKLLIFLIILNSNQIIRSIARSDRALAAESQSQQDDRAIIREITVTGSTVFTAEELQKIVAPYIGQEITISILAKISENLSKYYLDRGYITSEAYLPPQSLNSGIIEVRIVEGKLPEIDIEGLERVPKKYLLDRLPTIPPLNIEELESALKLLKQDPLFEEFQTKLLPGTTPDASILEIKLKEAPNYSLSFQFDNYQSPLIGEDQGTISFNSNNFLGFGDRLNLSYGFTDGVDKIESDYSFPINTKGGTITVSYGNGENQIIEQFQELGIRTESERLAIAIKQPLILTADEQFALSINFDIQNSQSFVLDNIPFSLSEGAIEGKTKVVALRFGQEWVNRSSQRIFALQSLFSIGLGILGATDNFSGIDGQFVTWQGQFKYLEKLDEKIIFSLRSNLQLTDDELLNVELFDVGGINSVRGYRRSQIVDDSGFNASLEINFQPLDWLTISPFVDFGTVWGSQSETDTIGSVGLSLQAKSDWGYVRLDYAIPLVDVEEGDSLQEDGWSIGAGINYKF